jgi:hypothetical protein
MAQLLLSENVPLMHESDDEDMLANAEEVNNYKGMYQHEEEEPEQKYFEFEAHFCFESMVERLEEVRRQLSPSRRGSSAPSPSLSKGIFILIKEQNFRKANSSSKPYSRACNLSGEPGVPENNFLFSLNNASKSRNLNHMEKDTIYKPGTGVHINNHNLNFYGNHQNQIQNQNLNQSQSLVANTSNISHIAIAPEQVKPQPAAVKLKLSANNKDNIIANANISNSKVYNAYTSFTNDLHGNININMNQSHFLNQSQSNLSQKYTNNNTTLFKKSNAVILIEKKK